MRLIFAGTPPFAAAALDALADAGHDVALVLTQPDRPAGRGLKRAPSAVKQAAAARGLAVYQPESLKSAEAQQRLAGVGADVMVVAAYGLMLPQAVLDLPRQGCLNIHASLLPRWRGAAPIQRAILAGDAETGITIMQMDAGLDTGPMLLKAAIAIAPDDTTRSLTDKLAGLGAATIVTALSRLDTLSGEPQDAAQATYAAKITKDEARLDWTRPADVLARAVRAFDPMPGAYTTLDGAPLKIWQADVVDGAAGSPGEILVADAAGIVVACGQDALRIRAVQPAGGRRMDAGAFLAGHPLAPGARLGA
jgi:methionyl-tRNA formyltransferase